MLIALRIKLVVLFSSA
jgi:NADPH:quinone reductase-like Zn-dependent oxidoreductase